MPIKGGITMLRAQIYYDKHSFLGPHWVCRLYEPGGYTWHGQVAKTNFAEITEDEFKNECVQIFGELDFFRFY